MKYTLAGPTRLRTLHIHLFHCLLNNAWHFPCSGTQIPDIPQQSCSCFPHTRWSSFGLICNLLRSKTKEAPVINSSQDKNGFQQGSTLNEVLLERPWPFLGRPWQNIRTVHTDRTTPLETHTKSWPSTGWKKKLRCPSATETGSLTITAWESL